MPPIRNPHREKAPTADEPLSTIVCSDKAQACRDLAKKTYGDEERIMLEHIAATWERIARSVSTLH